MPNICQLVPVALEIIAAASTGSIIEKENAERQIGLSGRTLKSFQILLNSASGFDYEGAWKNKS